MNQATNYRIATTVVITVILIGGVFLFYRRAGEEGSIAATTPPLATTSTPLIGAHTKDGVTGSGNFTVSVIPTIKAPDFSIPIAFSADVSSDVRVAIESSFATLKAAHARDSTNLKAWLDLGALRKMAGDWKGAETDWRFVTQASPKNTAAFWNLGDLYTNFIKDYAKAEAAFKQVVTIEPNSSEGYRALFDLYTLQKKDTSAAEAILKKGIAGAPDAVDLQVLLARLYKGLGRATDAKTVYDAAIANATRLGETSLAAQIKAEAGE